MSNSRLTLPLAIVKDRLIQDGMMKLFIKQNRSTSKLLQSIFISYGIVITKSIPKTIENQ